MLTIFTHCKAFTGHIGVIQRNAIQSWMALDPPCEVVLCGDRDGTAETARALGLRHVPDTRRTGYGTPLLNDLFEKVGSLAQHDLLCFINCDIILPSNFIDVVRTVRDRKRRFLLMGECWDLDVTSVLDFSSTAWEDELGRAVRERGKRRGIYAIDYFVFPRSFYGQIPAFALGTARFDNWLIWRARDLGGAAVDASPVMMPVHQNHDYSHIAGGKAWARGGVDAEKNMQLAGGWAHIYTTRDATHRVERDGLRRDWATFFRFGMRRETQTEIRRDVVARMRRGLRTFGLGSASLARLKEAVTRAK